MLGSFKTFTKGGAFGYLGEDFCYPRGDHNNDVSYDMNIINIE